MEGRSPAESKQGATMEKAVTTIIWIISLCMAGAEGPFWINCLGGVLFLWSCIVIGNILVEEGESVND